MSAVGKMLREDGSTRAGSLTGVLVISRILGLARDIVLASLLGAGPAADALRVALKIPSMIRDLVAEGSISAAFMPSYEQQKFNGGIDAAHRFSRSVLTLLLFGSSALALLLWQFAPTWVEQLSPGLADPSLAVQLLVELLPFLLLVPLLAVLRGILLGANRNRSAVASQALQNAVLVVAGLSMVNTGLTGPESASGWIRAFLGGAVLSLILLAYSSRKAQPLPWPTPQIRVSGIDRFLRDLGIQLLASSVVYINSILALRFASNIGTGAITQLEIAFRFHFLPIALIGVAIGTIAGVDASRLAAKRQSRALALRIGRNLRNSLFISLPAAVGLAILAGPLIRLFFQHGNFNADDASQTIATLKVFCLAIPLGCLCPTLIRTSMALGQRKLLIIASIAALLVNWTMLIVLADGFDGRWGVPGLAIAAAASTMTSWLFLEFGLRKKIALPRLRRSAIVNNLLVALAVAGSTTLVSQLASSLLGVGSLSDIVSIGISIPAGILVAISLGRIIGIPEVKALEKLVHSASRVLHRS
ncbi:MAG: lipid II flippase MurJ [Planctomycetota bacterium]